MCNSSKEHKFSTCAQKLMPILVYVLGITKIKHDIAAQNLLVLI